MRIAILIPVYNEQRTIADVLRGAKTKSSDVIIVIDGSSDRSIDIVRREGGVHLLVNDTNRGLTEAMKVGLSYALEKGFDAVVKIDGDGQMNITQYDALVRAYTATNKDIVLARYNRDTPWMIRKDIWLYSWLFRLATKVNVRDIISEYRLLSRRAMEGFVAARIPSNASNMALIDLVKAGCTVAEIESGVNYNFSQRRPVHLNALIDCRRQFIVGLWNFGTVRSKIVSALSIVPLILLLFVNVTIGARYNTMLSKRQARV